MINVVFIGNRTLILSSLIANPYYNLVHAFVTDENLPGLDEIPHTILKANGEKLRLLSELAELDFELCVSAGCPYLLLKKQIPKAVYINCHPSPLPLGKGRHPINHAILSNEKIAGATIHYLTDELDGGDILAQEAFEVTDDLDVQILYPVLFELENELFNKVLNNMKEYGTAIQGTAQSSQDSYYSRPERLTLDAERVSSEEVERYLRAFSHKTQGVEVICGSSIIKAFSGQKVTNPFYVSRYSNIEVGSSCLINDSFALIKLIDGLFRFNLS